MANSVSINVGGLECYADYILSICGRVVACSFYDRSTNKVKAVGVKMGKQHIVYQKGYRRLTACTEGNYKVVASEVKVNRDRFYAGLAVSERLGESCFITTKNDVHEDFYNFLMNKFSLPLLSEWIPYILNVCTSERLAILQRQYEFVVVGEPERKVTLNGKQRTLGELIGYYVGLTEEQLEEIVSEGLKSGEIKVANKKSEPLEFKDFNDYITKYGTSLVGNLEKEINPLTGLKPTVDSVALYNMRLYPQQAAAVNGIIELKKSGSRYALLNEGMGVGKTIQALSVCEGYYNDLYMKKYCCDLKTAIESGKVAYRVAILCPGHLVNKWAQTIRDEIPQAKAITVNSLSQLVALREHGKTRDGKEFYVMSKDFSKLGSILEPIPNKVVSKIAYNKVCKGCRENGFHTLQKGYGQHVCPECGSREWVKEKISLQPFRGLVCPECGELLIRANLKPDNEKTHEELQDSVLTPADFAGRTTSNSVCYHCGAQLWGTNAKTISQGSGKDEFIPWQQRKKKWQKIRHFKNFSRKSNTNSFVLVNWEKASVDQEGRPCVVRDMTGINDYLMNNTVPDGQYELIPQEGGARKYAPALYIKKYLKGFFDVLILDECHKFEGAGTAQAQAAHALMKASEFTLGLTGTLLNGMAHSIFYLLFMLDPKRMREKGFEYTNMMDFARRYGCVETVHEASDDEDMRYNSSSRGRQIGQPRVKPGISPLVYTDFLLDKAVFLDLSDLSKYLPSLTEKVEIIPQEEDTAAGYHMDIEMLKSSLKKAEGKKMMSYVLNYGLSYPDKPYGRKPIMSITMNDTLICNPTNCDQYADGSVLLNKEQRLIEIANEEIQSGRNLFIFCSYTGDAESNVTERLKELIERECNVRGMVQIITASNPQAVEREEWMHGKAASGIRVFICNPKVVETGLDFCFKHMGKEFNYPTLVFYQMSYELAVLWQASRRAYRLNQREECRNYYLCYENTLQQVAVQLMAEKQVATSAIQGKFSAEGLASMANGVDPRVKLAQALADGDTGDRESLENMFDVLNSSNNADDDSDGGIVSLTYEEVMGYAREVTPNEEEELFILPMLESVAVTKEEVPVVVPVVNEPKATKAEAGQMSLFDMFDNMFETTPEAKKVKKPSSKKKVIEGQMSLFDMLAS